ncbi:MAG: hypothetical protein K1X75_08510 [Leptospirales bacterium]|nr:hypothetical protein [Leptospirales bacterium]
MKRIALITAGLIALLIGSLSAQPRTVNRTQEAADYPDLQATENQHQKNIFEAYKRLATVGWLVQMAQADRATGFQEAQDPLNFEYTFRFIKYTPRNTYIRYVKEEPQFLLNSFGAVDQIRGAIANKVQAAKSAGVTGATDIQFQTRDGIELTQFDFIYANDPDQRRAIGSRRKSLTLFFTQTNQQPDAEQQFNLSLVVSRIVEDNFRQGVRNVQLIIDPSPQDEKMDDVIILDRYNMKPTNITVLGMMSNTTTNPHRMIFKQRYYSRMLDHFYRLYSMVANYASKDDNDYNDEVLQRLEHSMDY